MIEVHARSRPRYISPLFEPQIKTDKMRPSGMAPMLQTMRRRSRSNTVLLVVLGILLVISGQPHRVSGIQCERITVTACQGLGYNMTAMPNLAGHTTQTEAEVVISSLQLILDSQCSRHARFLICASIFPLCTPDVSRPVAACKSLCETVRTDCTADPALAAIWPAFINCDTLPQPDRQELCMQVPDEDTIRLAPTALNKLIPGTAIGAWPWLQWKNANVVQPMNPVICPVNYTAVSSSSCGPLCGTDAMFTNEQKRIADTWTLALSAICFILTLFSLVTFWAEPMRFGFPERPVLFLALCYNLLSVAYLERVIFHNPLKDEMIPACGTSPTCLASFILTSYLTLCAAHWWLIFSICWYLSTEKQWSSEALEKKSGLIHVLAWVPPIIPPIAAFLWDTVRPHELTGMCTSYGFVEVPAMVLLLVGAVFTVLASRSLQGLRTTVTGDDSFHKRLSQIRTRIVVFSCVFFAPALLAVVLGFLENGYIVIPACVFGDPCVATKRYSSVPTLLRLFFTLAGGSLAGMWVWSKKTCESYRSRMAHPGCGGGPAYLVAAGGGGMTTKSAAMLQKKFKHVGPLYAGINFHNVPAAVIRA